MKIASISDIHGNLDALKSVISDIDNQNAEKIFICGDLVMAGPEPVETLDYIINLIKERDVTIILGNTDEMIIRSSGTKNDPYIPPDEIMANSMMYARKILGKDQIEFLKTLTEKLEVKVGRLKILLTHGSPRKINENIAPDLDEAAVKEIISGTDADIILCGHTHLPVIYSIGSQTVINDGSIGRPFTETPKACYAIIDYPDLRTKEFSVCHRFVDYDCKSASEKLAKLPFKGSENLARMLIKATPRYT